MMKKALGTLTAAAYIATALANPSLSYENQKEMPTPVKSASIEQDRFFKGWNSDLYLKSYLFFEEGVPHTHAEVYRNCNGVIKDRPWATLITNNVTSETDLYLDRNGDADVDPGGKIKGELDYAGRFVSGGEIRSPWNEMPYCPVKEQPKILGRAKGEGRTCKNGFQYQLYDVLKEDGFYGTLHYRINESGEMDENPVSLLDSLNGVMLLNLNPDQDGDFDLKRHPTQEKYCDSLKKIENGHAYHIWNPPEDVKVLKPRKFESEDKDS